MNKPVKELENLARIRKLDIEPAAADEFARLLKFGAERLEDARNTSLSLSGRFDLAYNAAHAFSLAALRWHGFRSDNRYLVFQTLPHTLGLPVTVWRVLAKAHDTRNELEYRENFAADEPLVRAVIDAAEDVREAVAALSLLEKG